MKQKRTLTLCHYGWRLACTETCKCDHARPDGLIPAETVASAAGNEDRRHGRQEAAGDARDGDTGQMEACGEYRDLKVELPDPGEKTGADSQTRAEKKQNLELDGLQHFVPMNPQSFVLQREHDLHKMRCLLARGIPVVRMLSRSVREKGNWHEWLLSACKTHLGTAAIILQDNTLYRGWYADCLATDETLGQHVAWHTVEGIGPAD